MPIKVIDYGSKEYEQMLKLRDDVLRKPLNLSIYDDDLDAEKDDVLIVMVEEGKITGCCVLTMLPEQQIKLRQMAVIKTLQHKGIGKSILQFSERIALEKNAQKITLDSRKESQSFYEKNGYHVVGEEFLKLSIPHYVMEKQLGHIHL